MPASSSSRPIASASPCASPNATSRPSLAFSHHGRDRAAAASDHRLSGDPRLEKRDAERLVARRIRKHIDRGKERAFVLHGKVRTELHARPPGGRQRRDQPFDLRKEPRARAGNEQPCVRPALPHLGHRMHQRIDALVAADLADESHDRRLVDAKPQPGVRAGDTFELRGIDPDTDHEHAVWTRTSTNHVVGFVLRVRDVVRTDEWRDGSSIARTPIHPRGEGRRGGPRAGPTGGRRAQRREHVQERKRRRGHDVGRRLAYRASQAGNHRTSGERAQVLVEGQSVLPRELLSPPRDAADLTQNREALDPDTVADLRRRQTCEGSTGAKNASPL